MKSTAPLACKLEKEGNVSFGLTGCWCLWQSNIPYQNAAQRGRHERELTGIAAWASVCARFVFWAHWNARHHGPLAPKIDSGIIQVGSSDTAFFHWPSKRGALHLYVQDSCCCCWCSGITWQDSAPQVKGPEKTTDHVFAGWRCRHRAAPLSATENYC